MPSPYSAPSRSSPSGRAGSLEIEVDHVHPEAVDPAVQPPVHHRVDRRADVRVLPVEVRLLAREQVQVVLVRHRVELPGRAGEERAPVVRLPPPPVPVALGVLAARARLEEPGMLVGRVVDHEVHDELHAALVDAREQPVEVRQRAERRLDVLVVGDVVAGVVLRRRVDGGEPEHADPERRQVVEPRGDPGQVPDPVPVGVGEAARVDLVDGGGLPPRGCAHRGSPAGCRRSTARAVAQEAGRGQHAVAGQDRHRGVVLERRGPRRPALAHGEGRGRVRVGGPQVRADDRDRERAGRRPARARVDDVRAALVRAGRRHRGVVQLEHRGEPVAQPRVADPDPPGTAAQHHVAARVDQEAPRAGPLEQRGRALGRPALHQPGRVQPAGERRARVERAVGRRAQLVAALEHRAHVRVRRGPAQLAAVEAADLAARVVRAERGVDEAQPREDLVEGLRGGAARDVDPHRHAHHVLDALSHGAPP